MRCLVTGGAGFIGSHLVDELLRCGHKVVVLDDLSTGNIENLRLAKKKIGFMLVERSITQDLTPIFKNHSFDTVFHLAALSKIQFSIKYPVITHEVNVNGTFQLLLACQKYKVKRFVFSSSSSVYGDQKKLPLKEEVLPKPLCPYAVHKLLGEHYCRQFGLFYNLETVCLRYLNVFGPRQDPRGDYANLIPKFISLISRGIRPTINGDGRQKRDFIYVSDVVRANILAAMTDNKKCFGEVFNVGFGRNISVNDVTKKIIKFTKVTVKPIHGPALVEPRHTLADTSKAKHLLGWQPKNPFDQGLEETVRYFVKS